MKNRIRQIRTAKGMTQEELASAAHLTRLATISDLETGKTNPRLSTLEAVAAALDVRVVDLFADEGDDPSARELYNRIMALPEDQRLAYLTLIPPSPEAK